MRRTRSLCRASADPPLSSHSFAFHSSRLRQVSRGERLPRRHQVEQHPLPLPHHLPGPRTTKLQVTPCSGTSVQFDTLSLPSRPAPHCSVRTLTRAPAASLHICASAPTAFTCTPPPNHTRGKFKKPRARLDRGHPSQRSVRGDDGVPWCWCSTHGVSHPLLLTPARKPHKPHCALHRTHRLHLPLALTPTGPGLAVTQASYRWSALPPLPRRGHE